MGREQKGERKGLGRGKKGTLARKPLVFEKRPLVFMVEIILVPSATRLKLLLTSSSGRTKKFEFFHWLTKK